MQALDKCQLGEVLRAKDEKLDATGEKKKKKTEFDFFRTMELRS